MDSCVVFYDQKCTICQKTKRVIQTYDQFNHVKWVDLHEPELEQQYPFVQSTDLTKEMHVLINSTYVYRGFDGVIRLLEEHALLKYPMRIINMRPFNVIGKGLYRKIAENRPIIGQHCNHDQCKIDNS
ncbi:thiol-disulfide oxidoreductase DCC family protein [Geomicrobium sediminis]|uniref:DCC family thiol-disulfide oxidoreductase YuxK n=1 Tax=Geomicrobium sediminis TaxID=1347788 RepID=A0ABS2P940_9BACL|nr:DCC1-like thiol-disulfide oxidoreductase family protein [Geomicrobium sediminis]MBM7631928.1 putative DCC family thiol-disulfide oxidoreductase YuxK [Geomicrobium sediminis]